MCSRFKHTLTNLDTEYLYVRRKSCAPAANSWLRSFALVARGNGDQSAMSESAGQETLPKTFICLREPAPAF